MRHRPAILLLLGTIFIAIAVIAPVACGKDTDQPNPSRIPVLKAGEWAPVFEIGENVFPAFAIGTATLKPEEPEEGNRENEDPFRLGESWGTVGIAINSPKANCPVIVEISGGNYVRPSVFSGVLPQANTTYTIFPMLKYDYEKLLAARQNIPEDLTYKITIDGKPQPEKLKRVTIQPVNDCVFAYVDASGVYHDVAWLFASYVNENHPMIDQILQDALNGGKTESFAGYGKDSEGVIQEINAVWETLQKKGFRYCDITTTVTEDDTINSQHVRMLGESLKANQANCVDGSVLLASVFRKIGLNVSLVLLPDHMLVAVDLNDEGDKTIFIETTMLGKGTLQEAVAAGEEQFEANKDNFYSNKKEDWDFQLIDIAEAREMGILPLKDVNAR